MQWLLHQILCNQASVTTSGYPSIIKLPMLFAAEEAATVPLEDSLPACLLSIHKIPPHLLMGTQ